MQHDLAADVLFGGRMKTKVKRPQRTKKRNRKGMCQQDRPVVEARAAGIDIGAREIYIAVPPDCDPEPVRVFKTFTEDLQQAADWLLQCGVRTAAMESTGVYWIPLFEILEARGVKPHLVNARHMKNVPGRRTDWHDCQWIQYLHSVGLLRGAYRPPDKVARCGRSCVIVRTGWECPASMSCTCKRR